MSIFDRFKSDSPPPAKPQDPQWARNERGAFHHLMSLDTAAAGLDRRGGVYVIWHGGVHPEWVYVGESANLAFALDAAADNDEIAAYEVNGRLFVSWAFIVEHFRKGAVLYLTEHMHPVVENPDAPTRETADIQPVPLINPSRKTG